MMVCCVAWPRALQTLRGNPPVLAGEDAWPNMLVTALVKRVRMPIMPRPVLYVPLATLRFTLFSKRFVVFCAFLSRRARSTTISKSSLIRRKFSFWPSRRGVSQKSPWWSMKGMPGSWVGWFTNVDNEMANRREDHAKVGLQAFHGLVVWKLLGRKMPLPMERSVQQFSAAPKGARTSRTLSWTPCRHRSLPGTRPRELAPSTSVERFMLCLARERLFFFGPNPARKRRRRTSPSTEGCPFITALDRREAGKADSRSRVGANPTWCRCTGGFGGKERTTSRGLASQSPFAPVFGRCFCPLTVTTRIPAIVVRISKGRTL